MNKYFKKGYKPPISSTSKESRQIKCNLGFNLSYEVNIAEQDSSCDLGLRAPI